MLKPKDLKIPVAEDVDLFSSVLDATPKAWETRVIGGTESLESNDVQNPIYTCSVQVGFELRPCKWQGTGTICKFDEHVQTYSRD